MPYAFVPCFCNIQGSYLTIQVMRYWHFTILIIFDPVYIWLCIRGAIRKHSLNKPIFLNVMNKLNLNFHTFGRACFRFTSYHSGEKLSLAIVGTFVLLSLSNPGCLPIPYNFSVNGTHCTHFLFSLVSKCICY